VFERFNAMMNCHERSEEMNKRLFVTAAIALLLMVTGTVLAADRYVVQKFEDTKLGAAGWNSGYGGARVGSPRWSEDPTGDSNGSLEMVCSASTGDFKAAMANENVAVVIDGVTASAIQLDMFVPVDFPTGAYIQLFVQDRKTWSWKSTGINATALSLGSWNTISYDIAAAIAADPSYDVTSGIKTGVEVLFNGGPTWEGSVYFDNVTLIGVRDPKEEVVADFEVEALGANGWDGGWGDSRLDKPMWSADPTARSTGVLEMLLDASAGTSGNHKGAFANSNLNIIIEGDTAHTIKMDVYLPDDFPADGALQFFAQDRKSWGWQADWIPVSTLTVGSWNTLAFDIRKRIDEVAGFDVSTGIQTGVEFFFPDGGIWAGSIYVDNIRLIGVKRSIVVSLESPEITHAAAIDTVKAAMTGETLYNHVIEWQDLKADMGETYNIYTSSTGKITDVGAAGVIKISENVPRGIQKWYERVVSKNGGDVTRFYAVTATGLNDAAQKVESPVRDGVSNTAAITSKSVLMTELPLLDTFNFAIDGDLKEFRQVAQTFKRSKLQCEEASGPAAVAWTPASEDLNMEMYVFMDAQNLYIGAEITDDAPTFGASAWQGDGFDVFGQLTDMTASKTRYFGDDATINGEGGFRISYAPNAGSHETQLQKSGYASWNNVDGIDYDVDLFGNGYVVEMKIPFTTLEAEFGGSYAPANGQELLMKVDVNDNDGTEDPYYTGDLRTMQNHWGAIPGNFNGWMRAEGWTPVLVTTTPLTAVSDKSGLLPERTALNRNYPNPFNPSTTIQYQLAAAGNVKLGVFDVRGRELRVLLNGRQTAGRHELKWDGKDANGASVGSGVYFVKMNADNYEKVQKMLLVK
jgi:hypothetical protein